MSNKLTFGKFAGRTYEWVFLNAPGYAHWLFKARIYRQEHNFDECERDAFRELYRRATSLGGTCCQCRVKPVVRMGLTTHHGSGAVGAVGFYCDTCEFRGGSCTGYYAPSFFVEAYTVSNADQKMIVREIMRHYIGTLKPTQEQMEAFFHDNANFSDATAGFFDRKKVTA